MVLYTKQSYYNLVIMKNNKTIIEIDPTIVQPLKMFDASDVFRLNTKYCKKPDPDPIYDQVCKNCNERLGDHRPSYINNQSWCQPGNTAVNFIGVNYE